MRYHQVKDLVVWAADFHQRMVQQFEEASRKSDLERSTMVLDYLAGRKRRLANGLESVFNDGADHTDVLETWLDDPTDFPQPPLLVQMAEQAVDHNDIDAAMQMALNANDTLQSMYEYRAEKAVIEPEQAFFVSLAQGHESEARQIVTHLKEFSDL